MPFDPAQTGGQRKLRRLAKLEARQPEPVDHSAAMALVMAQIETIAARAHRAGRLRQRRSTSFSLRRVCCFCSRAPRRGGRHRLDQD
jgi:hypothetical protein